MNTKLVIMLLTYLFSVKMNSVRKMNIKYEFSAKNGWGKKLVNESQRWSNSQLRRASVDQTNQADQQTTSAGLSSPGRPEAQTTRSPDEGVQTPSRPDSQSS